MRWLISEEDLGLLTNNYEYDVFLEMLLDNGIISANYAKIKMQFIRFPDDPQCDKCGIGSTAYELSSNQFQCKNCRHRFSITSRTYIDNTKLELHYWWRFAFLIGELKLKSSRAIAADLELTQKTTWLMINTLRFARKQLTDKKFVNGQELDTYKDQYEVLSLLLSIVKNPDVQVPEKDERNPDAVALGRLGGLKGGAARAAKLSPQQRSEIAKLAAAKRWEARKAKAPPLVEIELPSREETTSDLYDVKHFILKISGRKIVGRSDDVVISDIQFWERFRYIPGALQELITGTHSQYVLK